MRKKDFIYLNIENIPSSKQALKKQIKEKLFKGQKQGPNYPEWYGQFLNRKITIKSYRVYSEK